MNPMIKTGAKIDLIKIDTLFQPFVEAVRASF